MFETIKNAGSAKNKPDTKKKRTKVWEFKTAEAGKPALGPSFVSQGGALAAAGRTVPHEKNKEGTPDAHVVFG